MILAVIKLNLTTVDWTAVAAVMSFLMIVVTLISLCQSKQQLKELKRQWEEANRPRLTFGVVRWHGLFLLKITNVGNVVATDIKLRFEEEYLSSLFERCAEMLRGLERPFCIEAKGTKYYLIGASKGGQLAVGNKIMSENEVDKWVDEHVSDLIKITGSYGGKYSVTECFSIEMFLNKGIVYEDSIAEYLRGIKDGLVMNNAKKHVPVQESLERIAKSLQILVKNMDKTVTEENEKEYGE